ncbi:Protein transport protein sec20 [Malassezia psittaci]|uniref:Protein transport protein sec20 n=1 Tax=Malassezia psittaci TaxID=1821823 RepID=A0AAF0F7H4_9BASI|nr:Protein transport protein sec20 [Malassezia psittaci]
MEEVPRDVRIARDAARRRVLDVRSVQFDQLMACKTFSDLSVAESELHATMQKISNLVREVREALEESETPAEAQALQQALREDQSALDALKRESRRVLLAAHRKVQASREQSDRGALRLPSSSAPPGTKIKAAREDQTQATSQDVHTALQRTVALMSSELEKSGYSAQLLEESSENLTQISESYASFGTLLHDSIDLIRQMERAELWDWAILVMSLSFFVGCVSYILYVRVISRGLSLLGLLYRASSLAKRKGMSLAPFVHTASISTASVSTALRRSPAEAPRKVLGHRENLMADAGRNSRNDPLSSVAIKSSRARGARRGVDARRKAEAFRNAEEQALTESAEEETVDTYTQFDEDQADQLIQSIEARFSGSPSEYVLDPLLRTLTDSPKTHSARKPRRKMGTIQSSATIPSSSSQTAETTRSNTPSPTANVPESPASDNTPNLLQHGVTTADPIHHAPFVISGSQDTQPQSRSHDTKPIQHASSPAVSDSDSSNPKQDTLITSSSSQDDLHESIRQKDHSGMPSQLDIQDEMSYIDTVSLRVATEGSHTLAFSDNNDQRHEEERDSRSLDSFTSSSAINTENDAASSSKIISDEDEDSASLSTTNTDGKSAHSSTIGPAQDPEPLASNTERNLAPESIINIEDNSTPLPIINSEGNLAPSSIIDTEENLAPSPIIDTEETSTPSSIIDSEETLSPSPISDLGDQDILANADSHISSTPEVSQLQTSNVEPHHTSIHSDKVPKTTATPEPTPEPTPTTTATIQGSSVPTVSNAKTSHSGDHSQVVAALSSASASLRAAAPTLDATVVEAMWKKLNSASESLEKVLNSEPEHSSARTSPTSQTTESISNQYDSETDLPLLTKASVFGEQLLSRVVPDFAMNTLSSTSPNWTPSDEQDVTSEVTSIETSASQHRMHDEL